MKKLLLCSGRREDPYGDSDWFRVDRNPRVEPDLIAGILPLPIRVINNRPWDRVALIHGIEHFYPWEAEALVREIVTILKPDGVLILEQPNLLKCVEMVTAGEHDGTVGLYGDPSHEDTGMMHRWCYTPQTLANLVLHCGFSKAVMKKALFHNEERDFRMEATL